MKLNANVNFSLLDNLYKIGSPSRSEDKISKYVQKKLIALQIPFEVDEFHQIYRIIPDTPLLSAHLDQVQKKAPTDLIRIRGCIYGWRKHQQVGLGADDKNGVWIMLNLIELFRDKVSFIFSTQEEAGGKIDKIALSSHPYALVFDRKGSSDIIGSNNDYCSDDLEEEILKISGRFKYKAASGLFSDADDISDSIPCVNISVGYYNPHTESEYTNERELLNALNFSVALLNELPILDYKVPVKVRGWKGYGYGNWQDYKYLDNGYSDKSFQEGYYGDTFNKDEDVYDYFESDDYLDDRDRRERDKNFKKTPDIIMTTKPCYFCGANNAYLVEGIPICLNCYNESFIE